MTCPDIYSCDYGCLRRGRCDREATPSASPALEEWIKQTAKEIYDHAVHFELTPEWLEARIAKHLPYDETIELCAKIAEAHKGSAAKKRQALKQRMFEGAMIEILAEERGEDIASDMIAAAIRALAATPAHDEDEQIKQDRHDWLHP